MAVNTNHQTDALSASSGVLKAGSVNTAESTVSPNATVYVDSLTAAATSTNADIALVAKGTGATLAQVPDGTVAGGDKRGTYATDWQKDRDVSTKVASGSYSTISGGRRNTASGANAVIGGGISNIASGDFQATVGGGTTNSATARNTTIAGGTTNTAAGIASTICGGESNTIAAGSTHSFVGGGQSNTAQTNTHATVCGGNSNTASGQFAFVGGGTANSATGTSTVVCGGADNVANSDYGVIVGGRFGTTRGIIGYHVFPACNVPVAFAGGRSQSALLLLGRQTTNDTPTVLTSNTSAASTTNQVILPNNSAYSFSGEVIAGVTAAGNTARWTIDGAIKRGANAASTAMVGTPTVTMTHNDAGAAAWTVAVTADTTNGGISVTVTGAAATTIRWVAKITTTEMTF